MSEETPKKKGRGPNSTAAGDLLIYTDASGIKWPGKHVRFNKGKTMKLTSGKQVACTITVRLDGQSDTTVVPYLSVTYLPKPGKDVAADPIETPQPPIWRSVHDVVDETDVVWDNELQKAYVMVDSSTGEVLTYEVEPGIQTLADLQDMMQRKGWQLGEEAVQPPIKDEDIAGAVNSIADSMREWDGKYEPATAVDAQEGHMAWYTARDGERHFAEINAVAPGGVWIKDNSKFLYNDNFGDMWGLVAPYKAAGGANAAEPTIDAPQVDRAAEEPKTSPTEMLALRWNDEILGPERLGYRIPGRQHIYGDRHYVIQTPGDNVVFAPGVTSILKATMPKPEELFKWAVEKFRSWEEYQRHMTLAQGKGSVIHGAIADAINGVLPDFQDTAAWLSYLAAACSRNGCKGMEREWLGIVQRSVASIRQWAADHKVVFLMVEKALYTPSGFAGQVDFLVEMDSHIQNVKSTKAALRETPRRVVAIVDLKTGNDSDQYPAQLAYYRKLLLEGFPHIKKVIAERYPAQDTIDGYNIPLCLLFPKTGWRKSPTYSFLDRTQKADEYASNEMQHHIDLFKLKRRKPAGVTRLTGPANFNTTNDGVLSYTSLEDVWKDKIAQGDLEPVEDINEEEDQE